MAMTYKGRHKVKALLKQLTNAITTIKRSVNV